MVFFFFWNNREHPPLVPTYLHTSIHTYIHTFIHSSIHPYIHTSIHPYIHTYIHTYIRSPPPGRFQTIQEQSVPDNPRAVSFFSYAKPCAHCIVYILACVQEPNFVRPKGIFIPQDLLHKKCKRSCYLCITLMLARLKNTMLQSCPLWLSRGSCNSCSRTATVQNESFYATLSCQVYGLHASNGFAGTPKTY